MNLLLAGGAARRHLKGLPGLQGLVADRAEQRRGQLVRAQAIPVVRGGRVEPGVVAA